MDNFRYESKADLRVENGENPPWKAGIGKKTAGKSRFAGKTFPQNEVFAPFDRGLKPGWGGSVSPPPETERNAFRQLNRENPSSLLPGALLFGSGQQQFGTVSPVPDFFSEWKQRASDGLIFERGALGLPEGDFADRYRNNSGFLRRMFMWNRFLYFLGLSLTGIAFHALIHEQTYLKTEWLDWEVWKNETYISAK